jgi:butyryl-CoA dehydrogenase
VKAFLPHLKRADEGHIVNLSSVFGLIGVPGQGAYNAAKFAVRGFSECLREELELEGSTVSVTCAHPGGIRTNIARNARVTERPGGPTRDTMASEFERIARTSPDDAAKAIVRGIRRNARRVLVGLDAHAIDWMQRVLPTAYQALVVQAARRGPIPA